MSPRERDAETIDREELVQLACRAARGAGDLLLSLGDSLPSRSEFRDQAGRKSSATDLVTEADRQAEKVIVELLLGDRPFDAVLGEEGGARPGTSGVTWIIDPLDGTTNFVYGFGSWAVSIAALFDEEAIVGVVHDPGRRETFTAVLGGGAALNGTPLVLEDQHASLAHALVGTGFSYAADRRREQARLLVGVLPFVRDIRRAGAAAIDLCSVAAGRLDAYFEAGLMPWDKAAGLLIANEAGASSTDVEGLIDLPTIVVARVELLEGLLALLHSAKSRPSPSNAEDGEERSGEDHGS